MSITQSVTSQLTLIWFQKAKTDFRLSDVSFIRLDVYTAAK